MTKINILTAGVNTGTIYFLPKNKIRTNANKIKSLMKDCIEVKGIQSPKQPQVAIFPDRAA